LAYAQCPMPYAQCSMPYALCPMPYALCPMPYVTEKGYSIIYVKDLITKNILDNWQKNT
jgi:hypothetical protein